MAWVRIDDQSPRNQKMLDAGPASCWLWVCGIAHAQSQLTDGFISDAVLPMIGVSKDYKRLADQLVAVKLFDRVEGGYKVHDYLDHNPSRAEVLAKRAEDAARKRSADSSRPPHGIRAESMAPRAGVPSHPIPSEPFQTGKSLQTPTRRPQKFGRITLHRWQLDELIAVLGPNAESFDLDEWVSRLSSLADQQRAYLPDRDAVWAWVQAELRQECQRRGLMAAGASSAGGMDVEAIRAEIARQEAEARR